MPAVTRIGVCDAAQPLKMCEMLFLRQQLGVGCHHQNRGPTLSPFEKLLFVTILSEQTLSRCNINTDGSAWS